MNHQSSFSLRSFFQPVDLTQGTCWKTLLVFAFPIIVSYLLQQVYSISDAAIVGQTLTASEVAGVNDTTSLAMIFLQFAFGASAGFCTVTSCFVGARDSAAYTYCAILFGGIGAQLFYNFICSFLRSMGDSATPLAFLLFSTILNVGLDLLFILSFHWGVAGAAIATVAAQLISTLGCFLYAFLKYPELRLHREDWRITRRDVTRHLIQGIPLGLQFSVLAIGIIVMQSVIVQFDTLGGEMVSNAAQNGFGAANKLNNLLMTPLNGLGAAMTSFTAQNLGAGDHARIRKGTVQALIIVWTMCLISIAAGLLLSRGGYLYIFLSPDKVTAETMRYGNTYLYVDLSLYLFLGFIFVVRNCVQGIGKPQFVLGAGAAELAARVSVCLLLPPLIAGGPVNSDAPRAAVYALCFADPFAWMAADAVLLVPFLRNIMKMDYRYLKGTM